MKQKDGFLVRKQGFQEKIKYKIWKKEFLKNHSRIFEAFANKNVNYILHDCIEEYIDGHHEKMALMIQKKFPFVLHSATTGSIDLSQLKMTYKSSAENAEGIEKFIENISSEISYGKVLVVLFGFDIPVLELDAEALKSCFPIILEMGTELYITNEKFEWIIEYLAFDDTLVFGRR